MNTDKMFLKRILYLVGITMGVYLFIQYILPLIISIKGIIPIPLYVLGSQVL